MSSRRKSRNRTIVGNLTDMQKRLKNLEARQAPTQLARKVVATQNIALRAVVPDVVADAAIVRRTLAPQAVISQNLAVVGDPDGAAVATDNIQLEAVDTPQVADEAITNDKLAGEIEDGKLIGISASKVGPDLLVDDQLEGISASKVGPDLLVDDQLEGISTEKLIGVVIDDQIDTVSAIKIGPDLIVDDQLDGISTEKLIGEITNEQLEGLITFDKIDSIDAATITVGLIFDDQIDGISGEKIIGGVDGGLIVEQSIVGAWVSPADSKISPGSIGEEDLGSNSVGYDQIAGNSIDTVQIRENAVTSLELDSLAVERRHLNDNVIIARMINAGAVQTAGIQNLAVTNAKIDTVAWDKVSGPGNLVQAGISLANSSGLNGSLLSGSQPAAGKYAISVQFGTGNLDVARGDHTHSGGTTVPSHTHSVSISATAAVDGAHGGHSTTGGGAATRGNHTHTVSVSGTSGTPSTIKLKKEVTDYSIADVKNLLNLNLKRYKYKNQVRHLQEGREWMYGYIAEEVAELGIEEIVGYDENKEPNAINYGLLSTLVLELVKVQQTEIDSLREEIQRLKEKI
jgi:hypothetical protein